MAREALHILALHTSSTLSHAQSSPATDILPISSTHQAWLCSYFSFWIILPPDTHKAQSLTSFLSFQNDLGETLPSLVCFSC